MNVIDEAPLGQVGDLAYEFFQRQSDQVSEIEPVFVTLKLLPRLVRPGHVHFRFPGDDANAPGVRVQPEGHVQRRVQIHLDRDTDHVERQLAGLHLLLIDATENDWDARKDVRAVFEGVIQPGREAGND